MHCSTAGNLYLNAQHWRYLYPFCLYSDRYLLKAVECLYLLPYSHSERGTKAFLVLLSSVKSLVYKHQGKSVLGMVGYIYFMNVKVFLFRLREIQGEAISLQIFTAEIVHSPKKRRKKFLYQKIFKNCIKQLVFVSKYFFQAEILILAYSKH